MTAVPVPSAVPTGEAATAGDWVHARRSSIYHLTVIAVPGRVTTACKRVLLDPLPRAGRSRCRDDSENRCRRCCESIWDDADAGRPSPNGCGGCTRCRAGDHGDCHGCACPCTLYPDDGYDESRGRCDRSCFHV